MYLLWSSSNSRVSEKKLGGVSAAMGQMIATATPSQIEDTMDTDAEEEGEEDVDDPPPGQQSGHNGLAVNPPLLGDSEGKHD